MDGYLDAKARQALRATSSRADITATSFQVYYTYSDLKAEPLELMLKYFDIGFYFADWGSIDDALLHNFTKVEKNTRLSTIFEQGQLTRCLALVMKPKTPTNKEKAQYGIHV